MSSLIGCNSRLVFVIAVDVMDKMLLAVYLMITEETLEKSANAVM